MIGVALPAAPSSATTMCRAARRERRHDLAFGFERRGVRVGVRDVDVAARQEAVALRRAPGGEAERGDRDDVVAVQREQAVRRPHELFVVVVVPGACVAHHLGDRQLGDGVGENAVCKPIGERNARLRRLRETALPPCRPPRERAASRRRGRARPSFFASACVGLPAAS